MAYTGTTAAILSNYDEALKVFYLPAIQEQLNHDTYLADMLDVNEKDVSGKNATINCHYGRNQKGLGARADGGLLPDAGYQKFQTMIVPMRYNYGRVTISGPTIAATRDSKGAYAKAVETEIMGCVRDFQKEINRQLWGCGYGILGRWRSTGSGTSYTIQKLYRGNSVGGDGFGSAMGSRYLNTERPNAVPVVTSSLSGSGIITVDGTDIVVTAVTKGTTGFDTITVTDPSVSEAAGTYYVRPGNSRTTTTGTAAGYARLEMMGLRGIVTDTDLDEIAAFDGSDTGLAVNDPLQNLAVGTHDWWKAYVGTGNGTRYASQRPLEELEMQKAFDEVEEKAGVGYGPDMVLTTRALRREFYELQRADRRQPLKMELHGGLRDWKALDYNGIPLMVDNDAIDGEIYFLTSKDLQIYRMSDYDWMSKDGAILSRIANYDAYEAVLFRYAELGCERRNSQGVMVDLNYEN